MANVVDFAARAVRPYHTTGICWDMITLPGGVGNWESIAFGHSVFIGLSATGVLNSVVRGSDGFNWSNLNAAAARQWQGVAFGQEVFNACAQDGAGDQFMRSVDFGLTWASIAEPANLQWQDIVWAGGPYWVAIAQNGAGNQIASSSDNGASWSSVAEPATRQWRSLAANPATGTVIAVAQDGAGDQIARSNNYGLAGSWASIAEPITKAWQRVCYGNVAGVNTFVALDNGNATRWLMYSQDDGATWVSSAPPHGGSPTGYNVNTYAAAFGNGRFVSIFMGQLRCVWSSDGIVFLGKTIATADNVDVRCVTYGNNRFVALGTPTNINCFVS
jgi:hypothetical protein